MTFRRDIIKIPAIILILAVNLSSCASTAADPEMFGIWTSTLDGRNVKRLLSDPIREINHARVSPDKQWITFTRYNHYGWNGLAKEDPDGYEETEIMLMRLDGSEVQSLVPPRKGIVAANGQWTEDGKAIIYVSNDNPAKQGQINSIDIATRKITKVEIPGNPFAADPHLVGNQLALAVFDPQQKTMSIWLYDTSQRNARQLTFPSLGPGERAGNHVPGDYDPKISPDGSQLVAFRNVGKDNWHMVVVDLKTGQERDISASRAVDAVPEWSSDGKKLLFWDVNVPDLKKSGLHTITPEGRERQLIPLPPGYLYTMPAFFPGEGSGSAARIIFSAQKNPLL